MKKRAITYFLDTLDVEWEEFCYGTFISFLVPSHIKKFTDKWEDCILLYFYYNNKFMIEAKDKSGLSFFIDIPPGMERMAARQIYEINIFDVDWMRRMENVFGNSWKCRISQI